MLNKVKKDINEEIIQNPESFYTWTPVKEKCPSIDGYYLGVRGGFTYDMGNDKDLIPEVVYYNGGRGCFNEDYEKEVYLFWTFIPTTKNI